MENETRIKILKEAIEELRKSSPIGMCIAISNVTSFKPYEIYWHEVFDIFPELLKHKPEVTFNDDFWFDLTEENKFVRIGILKKVLQEIQEASKPWYKKIFKWKNG